MIVADEVNGEYSIGCRTIGCWVRILSFSVIYIICQRLSLRAGSKKLQKNLFCINCHIIWSILITNLVFDGHNFF